MDTINCSGFKRFYNRLLYLYVICFIILFSCQVSAWNTPGTNEKSNSDPDGCDFRDRTLWNTQSRDCSFVINIEPGIRPGFEQELNTPYYNDAHLYLVENAIRIFRDKGYDNWANYLSENNNFHAIADGLTWADRYKDRLHVYVTLELCFIWCTDLHTWEVTDMVYAGYDHYYEDYNEQNPVGEGLSTVGLQVWKEFLGMFASTLVKGATGGILSVYGHTDPTIQPIYPSAALSAEKRFDDAVSMAKNSAIDQNNGKNIFYWPMKSAQYNSLFQLGWALHLIQDIGVIYHMNGWDGSLLYSHNEFEDQADNNGYEWQISGNDWKYGLLYDKSIAELAYEEALLINNGPDWEAAKSDNEAVREPVVKKGIQISEQFTAAVLAKYLTTIGIPQKKVPFRGHVEDTKNVSIPGAYVFYRLKGETDWKHVLTDKKGDFTLSGIDNGYSGAVIIRPVLPGYRYYGYDKGQNEEHLSLTRDKPLVYIFETVNTEIPYYEFLMTRNSENTGNGGMVMVTDFMPVTMGGYQNIPELIKKSIFEIKKEDDRLVVSNQIEDPDCGTAGGLCKAIPKETYIEVQLSNIVDLTSGKILSMNPEIVSKLTSARVERIGFLERFVAMDQDKRISGDPTGLFASSDILLDLTEKHGLKTIKMMTPQFSSSDSFKVYPLDVNAEMKDSEVITDMRYTFGPDALSSSNSLLANDMARIPAKNAEIEVTLLQSSGYIGPEFNRIYPTQMASMTENPAFLLPNMNLASSLIDSNSDSTDEDTPHGLIDPLPQKGTSQLTGDRITIRTDSNGRAALKLRTGEQAGKIGLHFTVISNPDAPGILPDQSIDFTVYPSAQHSDNPDVLPTIEVVNPRTYEFTGIADIGSIPKDQSTAYRICGKLNEDGTFTEGDCNSLKSAPLENTIIQNPPFEIPVPVKTPKQQVYEPMTQQPAEIQPEILMNTSVMFPAYIPIHAEMIKDTDLPGSDYHSFNLDYNDPSLCLQACKEDPECVACTYVIPGVQGAQARCWLKNAVPEAKTDTCCFSWIK